MQSGIPLVSAALKGGLYPVVADTANARLQAGRADSRRTSRLAPTAHRSWNWAIEVIFLPSRARPTGFDEIAIPPIAPAVANAIATLTGERLRRMPFSKLGYDLAPTRT